MNIIYLKLEELSLKKALNTEKNIITKVEVIHNK